VELLYPAPDTETASSQTDDLMNSHPCGQAANYALECALAELWRESGIRPAAVLGHSLGDFAAAYVAGVLGLEEGLRLVTRRGELMGAGSRGNGGRDGLGPGGSPFVEPYPDAAIGVVNGPLSVVVSGGTRLGGGHHPGPARRRLQDPTAGDSCGSTLPDARPGAGRVRGSRARDPALCAKAARRLQHDRQLGRRRAGPSPATGVRTCATRCSSHKELRHCMQPARTFSEVGPQSTLLGMAVENSGRWSVVGGQEAVGNSDQGTGGTAFLPSLRPGQSDWQQLLASLGEFYVRGAAIDWEGFDSGTCPAQGGAAHLPLPARSATGCRAAHPDGLLRRCARSSTK
jgi:acyl transferase domain-containing protein